MLTDTQVSNLAAAVHALRPDWNLRSLTTFVGDKLRVRAFRDVAVALAWVATDEQTKTPARVLEAGPWWRANSEDKTIRPPRKDEDCPLHMGNWATNCAGCASDRLAGETTLPPEFRHPDRDSHIARARAELASARTRLCTHGIARNVCADCPTDPTDHPNEETA